MAQRQRMKEHEKEEEVEAGRPLGQQMIHSGGFKCGQLSVASCQLQAASCQLQVTQLAGYRAKAAINHAAKWWTRMRSWWSRCRCQAKWNWNWNLFRQLLQCHSYLCCCCVLPISVKSTRSFSRQLQPIICDCYKLERANRASWTEGRTDGAS